MTKHLSSSRVKRLTQQGLLAAAAVGLGVAGVVIQLEAGSPLEAAQVAPEAEAVDAWVYERTQAIRRELALDSENMAAIGLGLDESKAVLTGLKEWVEGNRHQLEAGDQAQMRAQRELQLAQRSVRVGPRDEAVLRGLPGLEQAYTDATEARQGLHRDAGRAIESRLTADQRALWQTAKTNIAAGVSSRYRFAPNMDADQRDQVRDALAVRSIDRNSSRYTEADRQLTASQREAVATAESNQARNMAAVQQAEEEVLPLPLLLQPTPAGRLEELGGR